MCVRVRPLSGTCKIACNIDHHRQRWLKLYKSCLQIGRKAENRTAALAAFEYGEGMDSVSFYP